MKWFSLKMKHRREQRGLSQDDLAKLVGVTRPTIANYEAGECEPTLLVAVKIAKVLNINLMRTPL